MESTRGRLFVSYGDGLYAAAKDDFQRVVGPLFDFAQQEVVKRGIFLPFGAILDADGKMALHAAAGESELTNSTEILPLLHQGLRASRQSDTLVVAVCEWVKITPNGGKQTDAVKVLVEHANGLTVAFYLPMQKKLLGGWQTDEMMVVPASAEVGR